MDFIIVGLGNPGKEYELTRHNVGYLVIDILCNRYGGSLKKETPNSMADTIRIGDKKVLIAKPTTYMNDSGKGVGEIIRRYKSEPKQLIVIQDELVLVNQLIRHEGLVMFLKHFLKKKQKNLKYLVNMQRMLLN